MDNLANSARVCVGVYDLLATMFREPLAAATLRSLRDPVMLQGLSEAGMALDEAFCNGDKAQLQEVLAVDYTQIFHGPRNLPLLIIHPLTFKRPFSRIDFDLVLWDVRGQGRSRTSVCNGRSYNPGLR